jgi:TatD DNase family protein
MIIDTHCHLDFPDFDTDREAVLARAQKVGVTKIINPGCDLVSSRRAVALAEFTSNVVAAVGVHPHAAGEVDEQAITELRQLAQIEHVVAIGEIGLDYFKSKVEKEVQIAAFLRQLALAEELEKPVIIHSREADADMLSVLEKFNLPGVFHCFGGGVEFAEKVLAKGFYLGFTGICTFLKAENIREVIRLTPLERILIETDAPYLAPEKFRGKRNEPSFVSEVARKIAEIKNLDLTEVEKATTENAQRLFGV